MFLLEVDDIEDVDQEHAAHVHIIENENETNQTFNNQTINKHHLGWEDRSTFRNLAIGSVALGLVSTLLFHSTIWSKDLVGNVEKAEKSEEKEQNWRKWFK